MNQQKINILSDDLNSSKSGTRKAENKIDQEMEKWKKEKEKEKIIGERLDLKNKLTK